MPRLSTWMLRLSLAALLAGATLGALLLAGLPASAPQAGALRAAHIILMLFGWLIQFVVAVGYWILPRYPAAPERGSAALGWIAFGLFQAGLGLALAGSLTSSLRPFAAAGQLLLAGATMVFLLLLVPRVKPFGRD
jgi:heme/copper-type cytochrome/quinol oxidase subunit 1